MKAMKEVNGRGPRKTRRGCLMLPGQGRLLSHETFELRYEEGERVCVSGEGDMQQGWK